MKKPTLSYTKEPLITTITTGNVLMDKTLRGGITLRSVTLIEGPSDTGKSVMLQHLATGALKSYLLVAYYTSEGGHDEIADQMLSLGLDVLDDLKSEQIRVFEINKLAGRNKNPERLMANLFDDVGQRFIEGVDVVVFDDLTWPISQGDPNDFISMLMQFKELTRRGLTILIAVRASDGELDSRLNKLFEFHISLSLKAKRQNGKLDVVNVMKLKKVANLAPTTNNELYFRVNPELGRSINNSLDVLPIFRIRV